MTKYTFYQITSARVPGTYVGHTKRTARQRLDDHVTNSYRKSKRLCPLLESAMRQDPSKNRTSFSIQVLEERECDRATCLAVERNWINRLKPSWNLGVPSVIGRP
jgi:hypothetical protein